MMAGMDYSGMTFLNGKLMWGASFVTESDIRHTEMCKKHLFKMFK